MRYGSLPALVTIMRRVTDTNAVRGAFAAAGGPLMASIRQLSAAQKVTAGLPEDVIDIAVRFPVSAAALAITVEDRLAVSLSGAVTNYAVKSVGLPDRRGDFIEAGCIKTIGG